MRILNGRPLPRAGFSLLEMMIAVTISGLMLAIVMPRVQGATTGLDVRGARVAITNLYARARVTAIQTRRTTTLNLSGSSVWITSPRLAGGLDTLGAVTNLTTEYGVAVTASGNVTILPTGLVNAGTPVVIKVTRSGKSDSVTISGYGRLQ
jgi:prepilin-type N-terminal cleavage/methylation domain-containing protein